MHAKVVTGQLLEKYTKEWQILIEALPYPVSILDTGFNVLLANKAFTDICRKTDVTGTKCYQLVHCTDRPIDDCPTVRTLKTKNPERSEIYEPILKKHLLVYTSPINYGDNMIGVVHSVMDITQIKESETSYMELTEVLGASLNELKNREQYLQKGKDAFLNMLEDISVSYKELEDLFMGVVKVITSALDAKSPWTRGHSERVAIYAEQIARGMDIDEDGIKNLRLAALLHDIGKMGTYDHLLDKPERLSEDELKIVRQHPVQGAEILKDIKQLKDVIPLIRHHHERIDGNGYPDGLKGENIPLGARIIHVADSYDSMTADRPYRPSPGRGYAISELKNCSGTQFDPRVAKIFLNILGREKKQS